jgi:hypothetical protein
MNRERMGLGQQPTIACPVSGPWGVPHRSDNGLVAISGLGPMLEDQLCEGGKNPGGRTDISVGPGLSGGYARSEFSDAVASKIC